VEWAAGSISARPRSCLIAYATDADGPGLVPTPTNWRPASADGPAPLTTLTDRGPTSLLRDLLRKLLFQITLAHVVFDSRLGDWAPVWMIVQPEVAKWTRACSYDRAGAGFGDPGWSGPHFDRTIAA
jgi:hypothetical protein